MNALGVSYLLQSPGFPIPRISPAPHPPQGAAETPAAAAPKGKAKGPKTDEEFDAVLAEFGDFAMPSGEVTATGKGKKKKGKAKAKEGEDDDLDAVRCVER